MRRQTTGYHLSQVGQSLPGIRLLLGGFWGQAWTLGAWCELRVGFRNFRLDRIRKLDPLAARRSPLASSSRRP